MRTALCLLAAWLMLQTAAAQVRTDETRTTVDSTTGETRVTRAVIVSQSTDITPRTGMLLINPLKFFLFYNLTYVARIGQGQALGVGVQMPTIAGINGFGVNLEVRFYPSVHALRGFYVAPNVSYNRLTTSGALEIASPVSAGVLLGWQWFPGDDFALGFGLGADYYWDSGSSDAIFKKYSGSVPALRFDLGYAW